MPEDPTLDEQLQDIYDDLADKKETVEAEIEPLLENHADIDDALNDVQADYEYYEELVQNLTTAIENHANDSDQTIVANLQASLDEATASRDTLLTDISELQAEQEASQAEIDAKQDQIETYSASMEDISASIESMFPDDSDADMIEDDDDEPEDEQEDEDPDPEPDIDPEEEYVDPEDEDLEPDDMNLESDEPLDYLDDEDL